MHRRRGGEVRKRGERTEAVSQSAIRSNFRAHPPDSGVVPFSGKTRFRGPSPAASWSGIWTRLSNRSRSDRDETPPQPTAMPTGLADARDQLPWTLLRYLPTEAGNAWAVDEADIPVRYWRNRFPGSTATTG